jgi:anthranilate phosphoribosyltransferase
LEKTGIAFLFAPSFHPAMRHAAPVRKELGVRTVFNILGPLTNPAGAKKAVLGVYSDSLCRKMAEAAKEIGFERMMAVHGADGLDEISVSGPTRICELRDGAVLDYMISPEEFGLELSEISDIAGGSPQDNARMLKAILSGELKGAKRDIVALNAAAAILVYGAADSWASALAKAEESIDSGAAARKLEELARQSNA